MSGPLGADAGITRRLLQHGILKTESRSREDDEGAPGPPAQIWASKVYGTVVGPSFSPVFSGAPDLR